MVQEFCKIRILTQNVTQEISEEFRDAKRMLQPQARSQRLSAHAHVIQGQRKQPGTGECRQLVMQRHVRKLMQQQTQAHLCCIAHVWAMLTRIYDRQCDACSCAHSLILGLKVMHCQSAMRQDRGTGHAMDDLCHTFGGHSIPYDIRRSTIVVDASGGTLGL